MITEALIERAGKENIKSINELAKLYKVKPAEVREAFDIWLSRQPKTPEEVLERRNERIREQARRSMSKNVQRNRAYQKKYYQKHKEELLAKKKKYAEVKQ